MTCGILLTLIGLVFSAFCFMNAVLNPWTYHGVGGLLGALLGSQTLIPFIVALVVMIFGLAICFWIAFKNKIRRNGEKYMKKTMLALCVAAVLVLAACGGGAATVSTSASASTSASTSVPASASAAVSAAADAARVEPLPETLHEGVWNNATFAASFDAAGISTQDGAASLYLTIYNHELFDMVDVSTLKAGDTLVLNGEDILVEAVEQTGTGMVVINGGLDTGGCDLVTDDDTVYYEGLLDGRKSQHVVGEATFPLSAEFRFIDNADWENPNQVYTAEAFLALEDMSGFTQDNTLVTVADGEIVEITRSFTP